MSYVLQDSSDVTLAQIDVQTHSLTSLFASSTSLATASLAKLANTCTPKQFVVPSLTVTASPVLEDIPDHASLLKCQISASFV